MNAATQIMCQCVTLSIKDVKQLEQDVISYGEYIYSLIKRKNISVSMLAGLAGFKSRTSIQRILKEECSIEMIEAFNHLIKGFDQLNLSPLELEEMEQALIVSKVGKDAFQARKIMLQIFQSKVRSHAQNPEGLNPSNNEVATLEELFKTYQGFVKIRFLIFDLTFVSFANELVNLIRNSPPGYVSISQLLRFNNCQSHNAANFLAAFELLNYEHFDVHSISDDSTEDGQLYISSNSIVVDKELADGSHYTDYILIAADESFTFVSNLPGNSLYSLYLYQFDQIKLKGKSIRKTYDKLSSLNMVNNTLETCIQLEKLSPRYIIKHSFSSSMIPFEILLEIISDSNYFGLSRNHPVIIGLMEGFRGRYHAFYQSNKSKVNLLTKRGLLDFVTTRMMTDHFHSARAFTRDEVKTILEFIRDQLQTNENFEILLLKNDHAISNLEFSYYQDEVLWIFDSYSGYGEDYFDAIIDSPQLLHLFDDFIKNELIPNHTLPKSETMQFMDYLLSLV